MRRYSSLEEKNAAWQARQIKRRIRREGSYLNGSAYPERKRGYRRKHIILVDEHGVMKNRVTMVRYIDSFSAPSYSKALRLILFFLIVVALFHAVSGREVFVTFSSFLEAIADAPKLDTSWIKGVSIGLSDWGSFNFLRGFVQSLISIVQMSLYLAVGAGQIIVFIGFFFSVFFMV